MTLPANDAFSFGLTGSHDPSRPAYSLSLRSTSPKIPFVSTRTRSPPPHTLSRKPSRPRRSMSNGSEGGHHPQHETPSQARIPSRTDRGALTRKTSKSNTGHRPKPPVVVPIDWEIPRKLLHSSIGQSNFSFRCHRILKSQLHRLSYPVSLYIPRVATACCRCPR